MTTTELSCSLLERYPEQNPFTLDPPLYNVTPSDFPDDSDDTPEFRAAACEMARINAYNPLAGSYGICPFVIYDGDMRVARRPFTQYEKPPNELQEAILTEKLVFLEQINPMGKTALFKVRVGEQVCFLKMFRNKRVSVGEYYRKWEDTRPHPIKRFEKECDAYAHLQHYGACDAGAVPKCYGWLELSVEDMDSIASLPGIDIKWQSLKKDEHPPKALLLEFFEGAQRLSKKNITPQIADAALRALYHIHASYVLHNDVHGRNILVLPNGRVVWIDFDSAWPAWKKIDIYSLWRQDLYEELDRAWTHFYDELLPDKRIGFTHWLY